MKTAFLTSLPEVMLLAITVINGLKFFPRMHFQKFQESGIFNRQTGEKFLYSILEKGGSEDAGDLFFEFMDREPSIDALLRQSGIRFKSNNRHWSEASCEKRFIAGAKCKNCNAEDTTYINYGQNGESLHCVNVIFGKKRKPRG